MSTNRFTFTVPLKRATDACAHPTAYFIKTWHITGENAWESPCECATVSCTRCVVHWLWLIGWWEVCVDRLLILISDISFLWEAELMRLLKIHTRPPELISTLSALSSHGLYCTLYRRFCSHDLKYQNQSRQETRNCKRTATKKSPDDTDDDAFWSVSSTRIRVDKSCEESAEGFCTLEGLRHRLMTQDVAADYFSSGMDQYSSPSLPPVCVVQSDGECPAWFPGFWKRWASSK